LPGSGQAISESFQNLFAMTVGAVINPLATYTE
jgi:hypothetical protein